MKHPDLPTFWMTPRRVLDPQQCDYEQQRALITHAVLYGGPLLVSDSDFINNMVMRDGVAQGDPFFLSMIERKLLQFAIREEGGNPMPLGNTAEKIFKNNGHSKQMGAERFCESPEFRHIEQHAETSRFSCAGAAARYHKETLRILEQAPFEQSDLPDPVRNAVVEMVKDHVEKNTLNWSYFSRGSTFWEGLEARLRITQAWDRYGEFINAVARGPYATFIPDTLGLSPTYSNEDKLGVEIWRGRLRATEQDVQLKKLKRARIGLADLVHGLAALSIDDVLELRASGQRSKYEDACQKSARGTLFLDEPLDDLHRYCQLVDDKVLSALSRKRDGDEVDDHYIARAVGSESGAWFQFSFKQMASLVTAGVSDFIEFGYQRIQAMFGKNPASEVIRAEREKEVEKDRLFNKHKGTSAIETEITADAPSVRDIFTTVA